MAFLLWCAHIKCTVLCLPKLIYLPSYIKFWFIKIIWILDRDGDEQLTEDEFADLPADGMGLDFQDEPVQPVGGSGERRKEFNHLIDKNKDGKADRTELLVCTKNDVF